MTVKLGTRLRQERQARTIALTALAKRLGYSKSYLSTVETGISRPSWEVLAGYERELGLTAGELTRFAAQIPFAGGNTAGVEAVLASARAKPRQPRGGESQNPLSHENTWPGGRVVVRGLNDTLRAAADLVLLAAQKPRLLGQPIVLTVQVRSDDFRDALRRVIEGGWDVAEIYQLDRWDERARLLLVQHMLTLVAAPGPGRFTAYALPPNSGGVASETLVVPQHGAMIFIPTQVGAGDTACCFEWAEQPDIVAVLRDHAEFVRAQAAPLLTVYAFEHPSSSGGDGGPPLDRLRFDYALTEAETRGGDRCLVKNSLSLLTVPSIVGQAQMRRFVARRSEGWVSWSQALLEQRGARLAAFHEKAACGAQLRDLVGKPGIENLVKTRELAVDEWAREKLTRREVVSLLTTVIDLLERHHPQYQIGLLDDAPEIFWEVVGPAGQGVVFLEAFRREGDRRGETDIAIHDPVVAEEFRQYFAKLWATLPERSRDKQAVIAYFQDKIRQVEADSSNGADGADPA